ncbi:MAG: DUF308 domain-containing protein [Lachnospiraceae bacterium]|nr:DUF308 domain-containing protein [Lachnospiraceae bacterium]
MEKKSVRELYVFAAAYILMGLFMVIFPQFTIEMVCYLLAAVLFVMGIFNVVLYFKKDLKETLYRHDFATGVIMILIALIMVFRSQMFVTIIPMVMGVLIFGNGVMKLQRVLDLKRTGYSGWVFVLLFALLCISVGVFVMLEPDFIAKAVMIVIGISMIFSGITDVMTIFVLQKQVKTYMAENGEDAEIKDYADNRADAENRIDAVTELRAEPVTSDESINTEQKEKKPGIALNPFKKDEDKEKKGSIVENISSFLRRPKKSDDTDPDEKAEPDKIPTEDTDKPADDKKEDNGALDNADKDTDTADKPDAEKKDEDKDKESDLS